MQRRLWNAVGFAAFVAVVVAGCGQGGSKIDVGQIADDQVALNVEGMV